MTLSRHSWSPKEEGGVMRKAWFYRLGLLAALLLAAGAGNKWGG